MDSNFVFGAQVASPEAQKRAAQMDLEQWKKWESRFKFISERGDDLSLLRDPRPIEPLLTLHDEVFLPRGKVGMIAAAGGTGKTYLMIELALAVATGKPWLGKYGFEVAKPGAVFLALGEEDDEEIHRRLHLCARKMNLTNEDVRLAEERIVALSLCGIPFGFVNKDGEPNPETYDKLRDKLKERAPAEGWSLLILDPGSRFMGPEAEKDNAQATRFIESVEGLLSVDGKPTILIAHHITKEGRKGKEQGMNKARGSSALTDGARWMVTVDYRSDDNPNVLEMDLVKNNYGPMKHNKTFLQRDEGYIDAVMRPPEENKPKNKQKVTAGRTPESEGPTDD